MVFSASDTALTIRFNGEVIEIACWGPDALRLRARPGLTPAEPHVTALLPPAPCTPQITITDRAAAITNGRITAQVTIRQRHGSDVPWEPEIRYLRSDTGAELLAETRSHFAGPGPRACRSLSSGSFRVEATFAAHDDERLMGLGQPQHGRMDLKGTSTNLVQQNTHVVVPFVISSRGYGFLWNNPATGRADFAANITRWTADAAPGLDYWICAGDDPPAILNRYLDATGRPPMLPDWATGFWQCKLRYRSQNELLAVARAHLARGLPLACIVIDFFHWTAQGEWAFDPVHWPDPQGMVAELGAMGVQTMVSIWPTVGLNASTWGQMREQGLILRGERGIPAINIFPDTAPYGLHALTYYDAFNPAARDFHWSRVKANYIDRGIRNFWLDSCEPEIRPAHADHVRTALGNGAEMLSAYPRLHADRYAQGFRELGMDQSVLLVRSTWAGGQAAPIILWSGDVWSRWEDFRAQIAAGCHAAMSGIGWWCSDIGGFYDGHGEDPDFRELLVRWFEFGVFSPICRLHGFRVPQGVAPSPPGGPVDYGRDLFQVFTDTGGPNEIWSFGPQVESLLTPMAHLRESLRPHVRQAMQDWQAQGIPPMRPLAFDHPGDPASDAPEQYLFGRGLLVAPVTRPGATSRPVHLPVGADWLCPWTGTRHPGGSRPTLSTPLGRPCVLVRDDAAAPTLIATMATAMGPTA